jgi:hypothetical protein
MTNTGRDKKYIELEINNRFKKDFFSLSCTELSVEQYPKIKVAYITTLKIHSNIPYTP